jgi:predicted DNA-binding protein (UPF0251 family)
MRPKKTRWINCLPGERCFRPQCTDKTKLEGVILSSDEFEAMRLIHLEKWEQKDVAAEMKIHRSTVSRILTSAHKKITDALVNLKSIKVEQSCCCCVKQNQKGDPQK